MECNKDKIYFLIETLRRCSYNATQIHDVLFEAWPNECLSLKRIRTISQEFQEGKRENFERKIGSGRPTSQLRRESVDGVRLLIEECSSLTTREIADEIGISQTMVCKILNDELELKWFHTRWVPHTLTDGNMAVRVERCHDMLESYSTRLTKANLVTVDEKVFYCRKLAPRNVIGNWLSADGDTQRRQTARRSAMENKFMVVLAVSQKGQHYFEILNRGQSINAERYIEFLERMENHFAHLEDPILSHNMRFQQDNAKPHTARITREYMENRNIRLVRQPPYSPDLNLCDRYIFPRLESARSDFQSMENLRDFLRDQLPTFTRPRMAKALEELCTHAEKVIENNGNYVD